MSTKKFNLLVNPETFKIEANDYLRITATILKPDNDANPISVSCNLDNVTLDVNKVENEDSTLVDYIIDTSAIPYSNDELKFIITAQADSYETETKEVKGIIMANFEFKQPEDIVYNGKEGDKVKFFFETNAEKISLHSNLSDLNLKSRSVTDGYNITFNAPAEDIQISIIPYYNDSVRETITINYLFKGEINNEITDDSSGDDNNTIINNNNIQENEASNISTYNVNSSVNTSINELDNEELYYELDNDLKTEYEIDEEVSVHIITNANDIYCSLNEASATKVDDGYIITFTMPNDDVNLIIELQLDDETQDFSVNFTCSNKTITDTENDINNRRGVDDSVDTGYGSEKDNSSTNPFDGTHRIKQGLTWISERTDQMRYSSVDEREHWLQQIPEYIAIEEIKRGQPVSIAAKEDINRLYEDNEELAQALLNSSETFICLTDSNIHNTCVGLALEYSTGNVTIEDDVLSLSDSIHVLNQGMYVEDLDYYSNAFSHEEINNNYYTKIKEKEYWPDFFDDYKNNIGKKVYVKGGSVGELTTITEESYFGHSNVIVIGTLADAINSDGEVDYKRGIIEVQLEGDDRGVIDSTQLELVVGEDFTIGNTVKQNNYDLMSGRTRVFCIGRDDDETFHFRFNLLQNTEKVMPCGFIKMQSLNGKSAILWTNGSIDLSSIDQNDNLSEEDRAELYSAMHGASMCGTLLYESYIYDSYSAQNALGVLPTDYDLTQAFSDMFAYIADEGRESLKDGTEHRATCLTRIATNNTNDNYFELIADDIGGPYRVYVSTNLSSIVIDGLYIYSHGFYFNKGYAVLADIRLPTRQNICGIYMPNSTEDIVNVKLGENGIFLKQGLWQDSNAMFKPGYSYYLSNNGYISSQPQEWYNSIVKIGIAQTDTNLLVDCSDSRHYNNGDLPVGYMKPSAGGEAEFGFWLMDGITWHAVEDAPLLYERLANYYDTTELNYDANHNFGTDDNHYFTAGYILPEVLYHKHYGDEGDITEVAAQIKYLANGVYKELPRAPFIRKLLTAKRLDDNPCVIIDDIDITSLMIYGPDEPIIISPSLENVDIKIFADLNNDINNRRWYELHPGFFEFDNTTYYGFRWAIKRTRESSEAYPYGEYVLQMKTSAKEHEGTDQADYDTNVLGLYCQVDPFAPPMSLEGYPIKVKVVKHDYFPREFSVEGLFRNFVKESIVDASDTPYTGSAVSGQAVVNYIKNKVDTNNLVISNKEDNKGTVNAYLDSFTVYTKDVDTEDYDTGTHSPLNDLRLYGDFRLSAIDSNVTSNWLVDFYNGLFRYHLLNNTNNDRTSLDNLIRNNEYAFVHYGLLSDHVTNAIDGATSAGWSTNQPHGIVNTGYEGNINASTLQSAHLGYGSYIFSHNADNLEDSAEAGTEALTGITVTIPYTYHNTAQDTYTTRVGNIFSRWSGLSNLYESNLALESDEGADIIDTITVGSFIANNTYGTIRSYIQDFNKVLRVVYNFSDPSISFTDTNDEGIKVYASSFESTSSIKYKYLLHNFNNDNAIDLKDIIGSSSTLLQKVQAADGYVEVLDSALQALYETPLATFMYDREYLYEDNSSFKRYFGFITEQVVATSEKFAIANEENKIKNKTTYDDVEYTYTNDEAKSISQYMDLFMNNNNTAQRVNTSVGILMKAAQETQERLLNLEIATYGYDSPTLPGNVSTNTDYNTSQSSTIAGLNRLIRALCREVFQDENPDSAVNGAWSGNNEDNYSRLDMVDAEINGIDAINDGGDRIYLNMGVHTYPLDSSITETVDYSSSVYGDTDEHNNDFSSIEDNDWNENLTLGNIKTTKAIEYIDDITYTPNYEYNDDFNGINDALNRVVAKLNQLTINVNGEDKIKSRPHMLDNIRTTLETLIRDIYDDRNFSSEDLTKLTNDDESDYGGYLKRGFSRTDRILQKLFNYDLNIGPNKLLMANEFNGRIPYAEKSGIENDTITYSQLLSRAPENVDDIFGKNASIVDVIIKLLTGKEENLVRTNYTEFVDAENNSSNRKIDNSINYYSELPYIDIYYNDNSKDCFTGEKFNFKFDSNVGAVIDNNNNTSNLYENNVEDDGVFIFATRKIIDLDTQVEYIWPKVINKNRTDYIKCTSSIRDLLAKIDKIDYIDPESDFYKNDNSLLAGKESDNNNGIEGCATNLLYLLNNTFGEDFIISAEDSSNPLKFNFGTKINENNTLDNENEIQEREKIMSNNTYYVISDNTPVSLSGDDFYVYAFAAKTQQDIDKKYGRIKPCYYDCIKCTCLLFIPDSVTENASSSLYDNETSFEKNNFLLWPGKNYYLKITLNTEEADNIDNLISLFKERFDVECNVNFDYSADYNDSITIPEANTIDVKFLKKSDSFEKDFSFYITISVPDTLSSYITKILSIDYKIYCYPNKDISLSGTFSPKDGLYTSYYKYGNIPILSNDEYYICSDNNNYYISNNEDNKLVYSNYEYINESYLVESCAFVKNNIFPDLYCYYNDDYSWKINDSCKSIKLNIKSTEENDVFLIKPAILYDDNKNEIGFKKDETGTYSYFNPFIKTDNLCFISDKNSNTEIKIDFDNLTPEIFKYVNRDIYQINYSDELCLKDYLDNYEYVKAVYGTEDYSYFYAQTSSIDYSDILSNNRISISEPYLQSALNNLTSVTVYVTYAIVDILGASTTLYTENTMSNYNSSIEILNSNNIYLKVSKSELIHGEVSYIQLTNSNGNTVIYKAIASMEPQDLININVFIRGKVTRNFSINVGNETIKAYDIDSENKATVSELYFDSSIIDKDYRLISFKYDNNSVQYNNSNEYYNDNYWICNYNILSTTSIYDGDLSTTSIEPLSSNNDIYLTDEDLSLIEDNKFIYSYKNLLKVNYNPKEPELNNSTSYQDNNYLYYNHKTLVNRINMLEILANTLSRRFVNNLNFEDIDNGRWSDITIAYEPYSEVTSIDDFFDMLNIYTGITFTKTGIYATKRDSSIVAENIALANQDINDSSSDLIENTNTVDSGYRTKEFDQYNIMYDMVLRLKTSEDHLSYNNTMLGSDYDNYYNEINTYGKTKWENLLDAKGDVYDHSSNYTLTSDMKAILKLLWGYDDDGITNYCHFSSNDSNDKTWASTSNNDRISILDTFAKELYKMPKIVDSNASCYDNVSNYSNIQFDPTTFGQLEANNEESILGNGHRSKFFGNDKPVNRLDAIEKYLSNLYTAIDLGDVSNNNFQGGQFIVTVESDGVYLNGKKLNVNPEGNFDSDNTYFNSLAEIVIQSYFNTIALSKR